MIETLELSKFQNCASLIRMYGCKKDSTMSWSTIGGFNWWYFLKVNEQVNLRLIEKSFTQEINLIFPELYESYEIEINPLSNSIIKSCRHTTEGYGTNYKEKLEDILLLIESELQNVDLDCAFRDKINNCFETGFDIDFKGYSSTVRYTSDLSNEHYIKYARKIAKSDNAKRRIDFLPIPTCDFNNHLISLSKVKEIIESSTYFINTKKGIKKHCGYIMDLAIEDESLFLLFNK